MKALFVYLFLPFFLLISCSKSSGDMASNSATGAADTAAASDSTNMVSLDTLGAVVNLPNLNKNEKDHTNAVPSASITENHPIKDSVRIAYKKVNPHILSQKVETITPVVPNLTPSGESTYTAPPPPLPDPVEVSPEAPAEEEKPKNAVLGFSYFPQIPQDETRDLRVFVKVQSNDRQVTDKLKAIEKEDLEFTKTDDSSVVCIVKNIEAFKKLSIKPIYDTEDFRITRVDDDVQSFYDTDPNEQILDFRNGNYWHWKVKAIAKSPHMGNVTLLIKAETPQGQKIKLAERQINIKIGIDAPKLSLSRKAYQFADAHFKEILSLIIIPLALYLFNLIRKKYMLKKEDDPPKNS